ncbi:ChaN family lipoprotein [Pseudomonas guariconensis]|uniref:ChaN family lipoprotein n=1 Tax=Pseudomonas TaxID=286 RepID=UPI0020980B5A|nr:MULTISPECIES: ChaN family lipoprotein [Pseudomonas]MCO7640389.1 ChaN family lipoprotein [Pseudomonas sp. S 311-6]MCO7515511.1 ChaN family lipoprotein [Pseudomonas putida]MCO7565995.1 ChaN family lipoprotein [Pseudomonas mosselii]MCO7605603.1 ChaN family lipoprotein [Pseudomonas guariconensis]MCO7617036.1 ChaN family lipoprotein [Pseudomonas guariconensis]
MRHPLLCGLPILLALVLVGCQASLPALPAWQSSEGRDSTQLGQIRDLASGEVLSPGQLVARLAQAPRVLVGEKHDNPDHHALQLWLLRALEAHRPQGSLLLEMLQPSQQPLVDALQGQATLPEDLPKALAWQEGWDWQVYGPIVREALRRPVPLLAANLSQDEVRQAYRDSPVLPGERSNAPVVKAALLEQVRAGHCGLLPETQLPAMLAVQQQRDRRIAERVLAAAQPALLFTGSYHARKDLGVPLHLADLGAQGETKVLLLAEVGEQVGPGMADYVWYTAALPEQDYCAQLRR